ncbi:uncharacterized protein [Rutidosis leptorrhynchoides]|uniref:uncharacterized protein n=1 Tax=Rutidosis leptorrhynchoides TaxID=125765 RepID=UPI003A9A228E
MIKVAIGGKSKSLLKHLTTAPPSSDDEMYEQWEQDDLVVFSSLIQNIEPTLASNLTEYPTTKTLWDALVVTYSSGKDKLQTFDLHVKTNDLKQANMSIEDLWITLQGIWGEIERRNLNPMKCSADIQAYNNIRAEQKLFQFLNALDRQHDQIKRELLRLDPFLSAEEAYASVRKEKAHHQILNGGNPSPNPQWIGTVLSTTNGSGLMQSHIDKASRVVPCNSKKIKASGEEMKVGFDVNWEGKKIPANKTMGTGGKTNQLWGVGSTCDKPVRPKGNKPTRMGGIQSKFKINLKLVHGKFVNGPNCLGLNIGPKHKTRINHNEPNIVPCQNKYSVLTKIQKDFSEANVVSNNFKSESWIFDCGVTDTMTFDENDIIFKTKPRKNKIQTANGEIIQVKSGGTIEISPTIKLPNCLYIPALSHKLLSVSHVAKELNCKVLMYPTFCILQDIRT